MAEIIRLQLEEALPDLNYLEKKEIFTTEEISEILREREVFEYRMVKLQSKALDFLEAIDFESGWVNVIRSFKGRRGPSSLVFARIAEGTIRVRVISCSQDYSFV